MFESYRDGKFLNEVINHPLIRIGDYTYHSGFYNKSPEDLLKSLVHYMDHRDTEEAKLEIGKFCQIGSDVTFMMGGNNSHRQDWITHYNIEMLDPNNKNLAENKMPGSYQTRGDTVVGNDVWIGEGATIMPGVTIGDGAVIAAKSVVTKNIKPYHIVAGNPAKDVGQRFNDEEISMLLEARWWDWDIDKILKNEKAFKAADVRKILELSAGETVKHMKASYKDTLEVLKKEHFLSSDGDNDQKFIETMEHALKAVRKAQGSGPVYAEAGNTITLNDIRDAVIPEKPTVNLDKLLSHELQQHAQGGIIAGHPNTLKNIIPVPHKAHLLSTTILSTFMQNGVSGADAGQALTAELQCASAISKMAGYDSTKARGVFTFGGTGTNFYGIKMGLCKVDPNHHTEGTPKDAVIIGSLPGHHSHHAVANWGGIGEKNYISVKSNPDQTTNLEALKKTMEAELSKGKKIACIILSGGTTSCMGIDDFKAVHDMRNELAKKYHLDYLPHIHADSVLGWAYLNFVGYDFKNNPMGFEPKILDKLSRIAERIATLKYTDSFGVDFHKTGYTAYNSSMIIAKNGSDLMNLSRDPESMTPLFQEKNKYQNEPGKFTLETSRSSASMVGTWCTLQALGKEGYRALLGHVQTMSMKLDEMVAKQKDIVMVNKDTFGSDVFLRFYPPEVDAKSTFEKEKDNKLLLRKSNAYTNQFFDWFQKHHYYGSDGIALSKSSGAFYTEKESERVPAVRIYMLNPYITDKTIENLMGRLVEAKKEFDKERSQTHKFTDTVQKKENRIIHENTARRTQTR